MYLKKLEIFGFKSFADKTSLNFEPGITAIVGPNGCGKSNVFDAFRWVLGEQSVKELRGASMEDVIFNGTDKKPGLGFAEVSLTFANEPKVLPIDYNEVTVTRRLFRSGESEYLLNKTTVRLKDIVELFMGTGVGAEAYSLVQQGKVDLVVSARPEERRMIFDEAAGITKYKAKKKEALNKLKDTEANLLRINDIVLEVKRQISSLERQANKARRYKVNFEELKNLEVTFAKHQIESFHNEQSTINGSIEELKQKELSLNGEWEQLKESLSNERGILEEFEHKINEVNEQQIRMENEVEISQRQISFNEERIQNLDANQERLTEQKVHIQGRYQLQQEKISEFQSTMESLLGILQEAESNLAAKKEILLAVTTVIDEARAIIKGDEDKILELTAQEVQLKNELTDVMKEMQGCLARKRRLDMENAKVALEKKEADDKYRTIATNIETVFGKTAQLKAEHAAKIDILSECEKQHFSLDEEIGNMEKKKLFLFSQKEFIDKLQVQYEDMPDPVVETKFVTTQLPDENQSGIIGKVKNVQRVSEDREQRLRQDFSHVTGPLYEVVCETKFVELDLEAMETKINEVSKVIESHTVKKEAVIGQIEEQTALINNIALEIQKEEKVLSVLEAQKNDVLVEANKLSEELALIHEEIDEVTQSISTQKEKDRSLNTVVSEVDEQLIRCRHNIKNQQENIASNNNEREATSVAIAQIETEMVSIKDKEQNQQESLAIFTEELENSLTEINRIEGEFSGNSVKREEMLQEIEVLRKKGDELQESKQSLEGVVSEYKEQHQELAQKLGSLEQQLQTYESDVDQVKQSFHDHQFKQQEVSFKEQGIKDRLMQSYKIDINELLAASTDVVPQLTAESEPTSEDSHQTQEAHQPQEAQEIQQTQEPLNIAELTEQIEKLKKRCDSYGNVNLVAIDEYEELKERYEFLTKQQSDLLTAKESLKQTIYKINRTTRHMFMETFTKVSEEFRVHFRMLFGGGEAQLVLLDPENVLESGIEIVARPPGKKLQIISLLSGGEKSLTAIALVFGVFKVRPSPFCILDEIDAALDESNVGRFAEMVKEFSKIAQFIIITHNKKTISSSDVLYGITMQETGVSKVVSVNISDREKSQASEEIPAAV